MKYEDKLKELIKHKENCNLEDHCFSCIDIRDVLMDIDTTYEILLK